MLTKMVKAAAHIGCATHKGSPMAHGPKTLQTVLAAAAPPDLEVTFRAMFGSIMAYAEGKPFASSSDVGLALKMIGDGHKALLAVPGAEALQYDQSQPVSKTYIVVPEAMLADKDILRGWIVKSIATLPAPKARKARN